MCLRFVKNRVPIRGVRLAQSGLYRASCGSSFQFCVALGIGQETFPAGIATRAELIAFLAPTVFS